MGHKQETQAHIISPSNPVKVLSYSEGVPQDSSPERNSTQLDEGMRPLGLTIQTFRREKSIEHQPQNGVKNWRHRVVMLKLSRGSKKVASMRCTFKLS